MSSPLQLDDLKAKLNYHRQMVERLESAIRSLIEIERLEALDATPTTPKPDLERGSKTAAVKEFLATHPDASTGEVVNSLSERGIEIAPSLVSIVKGGGQQQRRKGELQERLVEILKGAPSQGMLLEEIVPKLIEGGYECKGHLSRTTYQTLYNLSKSGMVIKDESKRYSLKTCS